MPCNCPETRCCWWKPWGCWALGDNRTTSQGLTLVTPAGHNSLLACGHTPVVFWGVMPGRTQQCSEQEGSGCAELSSTTVCQVHAEMHKQLEPDRVNIQSNENA